MTTESERLATIETKQDQTDNAISDINTTLSQIADTLSELARHENRIDVMEANISDHETRLRDNEKALNQYKWPMIILGIIITASTTFLVNQSMELLTAAKEQKPITKQELVEAIRELKTVEDEG